MQESTGVGLISSTVQVISTDAHAIQEEETGSEETVDAMDVKLRTHLDNKNSEIDPDHSSAIWIPKGSIKFQHSELETGKLSSANDFDTAGSVRYNDSGFQQSEL